MCVLRVGGKTHSTLFVVSASPGSERRVTGGQRHNLSALAVRVLVEAACRALSCDLCPVQGPRRGRGRDVLVPPGRSRQHVQRGRPERGRLDSGRSSSGRLQRLERAWGDSWRDSWRGFLLIPSDDEFEERAGKGHCSTHTRSIAAVPPPFLPTTTTIVSAPCPELSAGAPRPFCSGRSLSPSQGILGRLACFLFFLTYK